MATIGLQINAAIKQQLKLKLTPELRQAIEVLALNKTELDERIDQELSENPLLEADELQHDDPWLQRLREGQDFSIRAEDPNLPPVWERFPQAENRTLHQHLEWQIDVARWDDSEKIAVRLLAGMVDERGYLPAEAPPAFTSIAQDVAYDTAVARLQELEPTGVGARTLEECLRLQLMGNDPITRLAREIVVEHLDLLANGSLPQMVAATGATESQLAEAIHLVRELEPNPGRNFGEPDATPIFPDVLIERVESGYTVELIRARRRHLRIQSRYKRLLQRAGASKEDKQYLRERLRAAESFIRSLEQRDATILRVARIVVERQKQFLDDGPAHLRPLSLRDVAQETGLHESTISRVTSNKYGLTPTGLISLKSFFHQAVGGSTDREGIVAEAIRLQVEQIVRDEDRANPLSDHQIGELLTARGIHIARRTVAKYRMLLDIPSRSDRRKSEQRIGQSVPAQPPKQIKGEQHEHHVHLPPYQLK